MKTWIETETGEILALGCYRIIYVDETCDDITGKTSYAIIAQEKTSEQDKNYEVEAEIAHFQTKKDAVAAFKRLKMMLNYGDNADLVLYDEYAKEPVQYGNK